MAETVGPQNSAKKQQRESFITENSDTKTHNQQYSANIFEKSLRSSTFKKNNSMQMTKKPSLGGTQKISFVEQQAVVTENISSDEQDLESNASNKI